MHSTWCSNPYIFIHLPSYVANTRVHAYLLVSFIRPIIEGVWLTLRVRVRVRRHSRMGCDLCPMHLSQFATTRPPKRTTVRSRHYVAQAAPGCTPLISVQKKSPQNKRTLRSCFWITVTLPLHTITLLFLWPMLRMVICSTRSSNRYRSRHSHQMKSYNIHM